MRYGTPTALRSFADRTTKAPDRALPLVTGLLVARQGGYL
jgi:hypothetical protein